MKSASLIGIGLPSVEAIHRIYAEGEEYLSHPENRQEKHHRFLGMTLTSYLGMGSWFAGTGRERYVTVPKHPSRTQKLTGFLLVKTGIARFARRENDYIGYAFWRSARKIFDW